MDQDGRADLITGNGVCPAPFTGVSTLEACTGTDTETAWAHVVDWNGDGVSEVLVTPFTPEDDDVGPNSAILPLSPLSLTWDVPTGLREAVPQFALGTGSFADFDGDGVMDVFYQYALLSPAEARVYDGFYLYDAGTAATTRPGLNGGDSYHIADVDGDGALEMLTSNLAESYVWVLARILPGRSVPPDLAGWNFYFVTAYNALGTLADLDGDGQKDVVFVKPLGGEAFSGANL